MRSKYASEKYIAPTTYYSVIVNHLLTEPDMLTLSKHVFPLRDLKGIWIFRYVPILFILHVVVHWSCFVCRHCVMLCYVMFFYVAFNKISVISWRSVFLVEETGVPGENHRPVASDWQTLSQCCIEYTSPWTGLELTPSIVIGTDCICSCKPNSHTITTTTAPVDIVVVCTIA